MGACVCTEGEKCVNREVGLGQLHTHTHNLSPYFSHTEGEKYVDHEVEHEQSEKVEARQLPACAAVCDGPVCGCACVCLLVYFSGDEGVICWSRRVFVSDGCFL